MASALDFVVTAQWERTSVCFVHHADLTPPAGLEVTGDGTRLATDLEAGLSLAIYFKGISVGTYAGAYEIAFRATHLMPFGTKSPDQEPPFLVTRTFQTQDAAASPALGGQTGPITCSDTWVATLTPK